MKSYSKTKIQQNGFSLVELLVVVVTIGIVSAIAIPNLLATKRLTNEASAIQSLRVIGMSQHLYQSSMGGGNFGSLVQLKNSGFINPVLGTSPFRKDRYLFSVTTIARTSTQPAKFVATARPQNHVVSQPLVGAGTRDFGTNESGVIYQTDDASVVSFDITTRLPIGTTVPLRMTGGSGAQN
jgi:prepilin-type N-terminal cleavage/methylation domain-containing protein